MKELVLLGLILFIGLYVLLGKLINLRKARVIKQHHEDFKTILLDDIFIHDGEVYVRYLDYRQYRKFKKLLRANKRLARSTKKLKGRVSDETI